MSHVRHRFGGNGCSQNCCVSALVAARLVTTSFGSLPVAKLGLAVAGRFLAIKFATIILANLLAKGFT